MAPRRGTKLLALSAFLAIVFFTACAILFALVTLGVVDLHSDSDGYRKLTWITNLGNYRGLKHDNLDGRLITIGFLVIKPLFFWPRLLQRSSNECLLDDVRQPPRPAMQSVLSPTFVFALQLAVPPRLLQ